MQAREDEQNVKTETPDALRNQTFSRLLTANHSRLRAFIYALVHDHHHTDDLMQEVAVVLWKRYDTFEEGTNFAAWAMKIARYTVLNWRRAQNKLPLLLDKL